MYKHINTSTHMRTYMHTHAHTIHEDKCTYIHSCEQLANMHMDENRDRETPSLTEGLQPQKVWRLEIGFGFVKDYMGLIAHR